MARSAVADCGGKRSTASFDGLLRIVEADVKEADLQVRLHDV